MAPSLELLQLFDDWDDWTKVRKDYLQNHVVVNSARQVSTAWKAGKAKFVPSRVWEAYKTQQYPIRRLSSSTTPERKKKENEKKNTLRYHVSGGKVIHLLDRLWFRPHQKLCILLDEHRVQRLQLVQLCSCITAFHNDPSHSPIPSIRPSKEWRRHPQRARQ